MSSVLRGINQRTKGNIESEQQFNINEIKNSQKNINNDDKNKDIQNGKKDKKNSKTGNQYAQIKISKSLKNELDAIKIIEKTKFDYELLQLMVDSYIRNELSAANRKKFKLLLDINEE